MGKETGLMGAGTGLRAGDWGEGSATENQEIMADSLLKIETLEIKAFFICGQNWDYWQFDKWEPLLLKISLPNGSFWIVLKTELDWKFCCCTFVRCTVGCVIGCTTLCFYNIKSSLLPIDLFLTNCRNLWELSFW